MHNQDAPSSTQQTDCGDAIGDVQVSPRITGITSPRTRKDTTTSESREAPVVPQPPIADSNRRARAVASFRLTTRRSATNVRGILRIWLGATAVIALAACREPATPITAARGKNVSDAHAHAAGGALTNDQLSAIASVRNATARFHDIADARAAGYTSQYPAGCAASPAGAQGFHYLNPALVDATVELLKPELVMYEPQENGSLQLVGVDYVVPFTQWTASEAPTLLGMPFMRNEPLGVWALHIWAWRPNPTGMFAMWNPQVSCVNAK